MAKRVLKHSFSLLNVDYVKLNHNWNYKNVLSPYYRLYYIDEGEGTISNDKTSLKLEAGKLYLIPSFTLCNLECEKYLSQYFIQFFEESPTGVSLFAGNRHLMEVPASELDKQNFKRLLQINPGRGINRSDNPKVYEKNIYYKEYQELNNQQNLASYLETQGILLQLISRFLGSSNFQSETEAVPSKIMDAMSYIQLNLGSNLTVNLLAERANQHPDYFSRLFYKYTGLRPIAYIHEKRIERVQYLITTTDVPFEQLAVDTGFESLPYFSRIFKKVTGMTPGQYREQSRLVNKI